MFVVQNVWWDGGMTVSLYGQSLIRVQIIIRYESQPATANEDVKQRASKHSAQGPGSVFLDAHQHQRTSTTSVVQRLRRRLVRSCVPATLAAAQRDDEHLTQTLCSALFGPGVHNVS